MDQDQALYLQEAPPTRTPNQARLKKFSAELLTTISEALTIASITPMEAPCHTPNRPARPPAALTAR